jgi:hypothetical protein
MKTIEDIRLEAKISGMIVELINEARDGKLDGVDHGDLDGIVGALAMKIIKMVREQK